MSVLARLQEIGALIGGNGFVPDRVRQRCLGQIGILPFIGCPVAERRPEPMRHSRVAQSLHQQWFARVAATRGRTVTTLLFGDHGASAAPLSRRGLSENLAPELAPDIQVLTGKERHVARLWARINLKNRACAYGLGGAGTENEDYKTAALPLS
jgi:hypothetical protein